MFLYLYIYEMYIYIQIRTHICVYIYIIINLMDTHTDALLQEDNAVKIPAADYERRLLLLSATCVAWSPMVAIPDDSAATAGDSAATARDSAATAGNSVATAGNSAGNGSFAILAVGTKAGRLWLWRYRPPRLALAADLSAESKCLQMVSPVARKA